MELPDEQSIRELADRIDAKDVIWFHDRYQSGDLAWLEHEVGSRDYVEMGRRIEGGDLGWVGTSIATLDLPGFRVAGPLLDLAPIPTRLPAPDPVVAPPPVVKAPKVRTDERKSRKLWLLLPLLIILALVAFLLSRCGGDDSAPADVVSRAAEKDNLSKWAAAADGAGVTPTLQGPGPYTVFAPSDAAFDALGPATLNALLANKDVLTKVVNYHVVSGGLRKKDLKEGQLTTLEGSPLGVIVDGKDVTVGGAELEAETVADNGVLHTIDRVLIPPSVDLSTLGTGTLKATADVTGALTLNGKVGSDEAKRAILTALEATIPGRVVDGLTVDPSAPTTGFLINLLGGTREQPAKEIRSAVFALSGATVNDQLKIVFAPKLEDDINALFRAEPIQFDTGSARIRPASNSTLDKAAALLKATPTGKVQFEGHTDSAGSAAKNTTLSQARAEAVKAALVTLGIDAARLTAKGYGSERPIAPNTSADGRQKNRRVEALVTP